MLHTHYIVYRPPRDLVTDMKRLGLRFLSKTLILTYVAHGPNLSLHLNFRPKCIYDDDHPRQECKISR